MLDVPPDGRLVHDKSSSLCYQDIDFTLFNGCGEVSDFESFEDFYLDPRTCYVPKLDFSL